MTETLPAITGGCYCGQVRYTARNVRATVSECHCSQCRKQAGHRYATTGGKWSDVTVETGAGAITWFRSSPEAERGFCSACGSHLFWKASNDDAVAILAASVDEPTGLRMNRHIFVADKGDYYDITDDVPQFTDYTTPAVSKRSGP
jgi:hypothetical protein